MYICWLVQQTPFLSPLRIDGTQERLIIFCLLYFVNEERGDLLVVHIPHRLAAQPDLGGLVGGKQQVVTAGTALLDVHGREDTPDRKSVV